MPDIPRTEQGHPTSVGLPLIVLTRVSEQYRRVGACTGNTLLSGRSVIEHVFRGADTMTCECGAVTLEKKK